MITLLIALTLTAATLLAAPLAIIAIGIHRQEHAGSLATRPCGIAAPLTGRLLALHAASAPARQPAALKATAAAAPRNSRPAALLVPKARS